MALDPLANRGPMVKAGMNYFSGKELRERSKRKGKNKVKLQKTKPNDYAPDSTFLTFPTNLANPPAIKR